MSKQQIIGLLGCLILLVGLFVPIIEVPALGKVHYFRFSDHNAKFLLGLVAVSAVLVFIRRLKMLSITGGLAFALIIANFIAVGRWVRAEDAKVGGGFHSVLRGADHGAQHYYQLQWGWAVMIIGALLLIVASLWKVESSDTTA
jgi:uncharacterized membrane protein